MSRKLWCVCLAIWFGIYAFLALTNVDFKYKDLLMGVLAAGVCVLYFLDK